MPTSSIVVGGCGSGCPIAKALNDDGFVIFGIDPSRSPVRAFHDNLPGLSVACEPVQDSPFFGRTFDAVMSIDLIFLFDANDQQRVIGRIADAVNPSGRFLFSA